MLHIISLLELMYIIRNIPVIEVSSYLFTKARKQASHPFTFSFLHLIFNFIHYIQLYIVMSPECILRCVLKVASCSPDRNSTHMYVQEDRDRTLVTYVEINARFLQLTLQKTTVFLVLQTEKHSKVPLNTTAFFLLCSDGPFFIWHINF